MGVTVSNGNTLIVSTSISNVTVLDGGTVEVRAGGSVSGAEIQAGAIALVSSGGRVSQIYLSGPNSSGGSLTIAAGASADQIYVYAGGIEQIVSGGVQSNATLFSGGSAVLLLGGTDSGLNVSSGGNLVVSTGGVASETQVYAGAMMTVLGGGTAVDTQLPNTGVGYGTAIVASGGTEEVMSRGYANNLTLQSGAVLVDVAGATLSEMTLESGVSLAISSGISALGMSLDSGAAETVLSGGRTTTDAVRSGATLRVEGGGAVIAPTLGSETYLSDTASGPVYAITAGGALVLSSGAVASNAFDVSGSIAVLSGGFDVSAVLFLGGQLSVLGGATDEAATIDAGSMTVASGGIAIDTRGDGNATVITSGGTLEVMSGSSATDLALQSGAILLANSGGSIDNIAFGSGLTFGLSAGLSEQFTSVLSGATERISAGATGSFDSIASGGTLVVLSGGSAISPEFGFFVSGVLISAGGSLQVDSGAMVSGAGASDGFSAANFRETVLAGGTDSAANVGGGATLTVQSGGLAVDTYAYSGVARIEGGATEDVLSGKAATGIDVYSGAHLSVTSGSTLIDAYLHSGASLGVFAGLTDSATTLLSGATEVVSAGAAADGSFISAGGSDTVLSGGTAYGDVTYGELTVQSGGTVFNTSIGGIAQGGATLAGTLDIAAGAIASGTIDFAPLSGGIASGAELLIGGTVMPTVEIVGFDDQAPNSTTMNDTIDLAGVRLAPGGHAALVAGNVLSVINNAVTYDLTLDPSQSFAGQHFAVTSDGHGGTAVTAACYAAGTRIATPGGDVAIESLRAGDVVLARDAAGAWTEEVVRWVGHQAIDLARHPDPPTAAPVRIRPDAFADAVPRRPLLLSPDHGVLIADAEGAAFVPARLLANGATVVQEFPPRVVYWHVELARHMVLLAEGLPAESFLDTGNRSDFAGESGVRLLHPHLTTLSSAAVWAARGGAPLLATGPRVDAVREALTRRARALGWRETRDPDLRIMVAGVAVTPDADGCTWLPARTASVRLTSRHFVPAWFGNMRDGRRLGVAVGSLRLGKAPLSDEVCGAGWHAAEPAWRWTDGSADVRFAPRAKPTPFFVRIVDAGARYWIEPPASAALVGRSGRTGIARRL